MERELNKKYHFMTINEKTVSWQPLQNLYFVPCKCPKLSAGLFNVRNNASSLVLPNVQTVMLFGKVFSFSRFHWSE